MIPQPPPYDLYWGSVSAGVCLQEATAWSILVGFLLPTANPRPELQVPGLMLVESGSWIQSWALLAQALESSSSCNSSLLRCTRKWSSSFGVEGVRLPTWLGLWSSRGIYGNRRESKQILGLVGGSALSAACWSEKDSGMAEETYPLLSGHLVAVVK